MDDDNPRIAILGAGPIGLEAALYARYLGYPTQVMEAADLAAAGILARGDQPAGKFGELASRLGVSALKAQDTDWQSPAATEPLACVEWHERYLKPLSLSDLISDVLHLAHEVVAIDRRTADEDASFKIRVRGNEGEEATHQADIVVDATGSNSSPWSRDCTVDAELGFANPEADYYVLGAKGGARSFAAGLAQIRDLFAILGEREDLDVYATMPVIE